MTLTAVLYVAAIGLTLGLIIRRVIIAQSRAPENDDSVPRGYVGKSRRW